MRIDVWSDVVCPWCYLGKKRLEKAIDGLEFGDEIEVRWRAFQLDPTAGTEPKDLATAIDRKYGPGAFDGMSTRLGALGEEVGLADGNAADAAVAAALPWIATADDAVDAAVAGGAISAADAADAAERHGRRRRRAARGR